MGSLLHCFCRHCCNRAGDDDDGDEVGRRAAAGVSGAGGPISAASMMRHHSQQHSYQIAPTGSADEEDDGQPRLGRRGEEEFGGGRELLDCCGRRSGNNSAAAAAALGSSGGGGVGAAAGGRGQCQREPAAIMSLPDFFRSLRERWRLYDSFQEAAAAAEEAATLRGSTVSEFEDDEDDYHTRQLKRIRSGSVGGDRNSLEPPSPLRTAVSFDSTREIPSIAPDMIVLPGSELQKQMAEHALAMVLGTSAKTSSSDTADAPAGTSPAAKKSSSLLHDSEDECVICMEGFDPTNPRMPTLCGCGENKTYFHLPCLYQWVEQSGRYCPSCRKKLRWEEF